MGRYDLASLTITPQQRRSEEQLLRILEAAERVLRRDGLDNFTIRAVAAEAEVSLGGIYRRFVDREEMLCAIHAHALERVKRRVAEALRPKVWTTLADLVAAFVDALGATLREDGQLLLSLVPGTLTKASEEQALAAQRVLAAEFLAAAQPVAGEIRRADHKAAASFMLQLVLAVILRRISFARSLGDGDWPALNREISLAATGYLTSPDPA